MHFIFALVRIVKMKRKKKVRVRYFIVSQLTEANLFIYKITFSSLSPFSFSQMTILIIYKLWNMYSVYNFVHCRHKVCFFFLNTSILFKIYLA